MVAQPVNRCQNLLASRLVYVIGVVDNPRDRLGGNANLMGNIRQRNIFSALRCQNNFRFKTNMSALT
jgi:hypothetical protein